MRAPPAVYEALARALAPPRGSGRAFRALGLPVPDAEALRNEHVELFGRAGPARLAPYETVHRAATLHDVLACYVRFGFVPDPDLRDRPDHVSLQLALAAALAASARRAEERDSSARAREAHQELRTYFELRLWPWLPDWFDRLSSLHGYPSHRALALVAVSFLGHEGERLGAPCRTQREAAAVVRPACSECGQPVGIIAPRGPVAPPVGSLVCVRCRVRVDLRRFGS